MIQALCSCRRKRERSSPSMITELQPPSSLVTTNRGDVPYILWLQGEQQRLANKGVASEIFKAQSNRVCLLRKD
jgi:hypothetical protein